MTPIEHGAAELLVDLLRKNWIDQMLAEDRVKLFDRLSQGYCRNCGHARYAVISNGVITRMDPCHCQNDE